MNGQGQVIHESREQVAVWLRAALHLPRHARISVAERVGSNETVLVAQCGRWSSRCYRLNKSLAELTEMDVQLAVARDNRNTLAN